MDEEQLTDEVIWALVSRGIETEQYQFEAPTGVQEVEIG